jgi:NADH-quinone oxidoreductase subunit L
MTVPLIVLATCSIVAGLIFNAGPIKIEALHSMEHWLEPVFEPVKNATTLREGAEGLTWILAGGGIAAFVVGTGTAYWMYILQAGQPASDLADAAPGLHQMLLDKWRIDELYDVTIIAAIDALADTCAAFDQTVVDGIVAKLPALLVSLFGSILRAFQTGVVHVYAAFMVIGLAAFGWFFVAPHPAATVVASGKDTGDYVVTAAPGMGYQYRWDADGNGQFDSDHVSDQTSVKVHVDEGKTRSVLIEATSAFGIRSQTEIPITREAAVKTVQMQLGQN